MSDYQHMPEPPKPVPDEWVKFLFSKLLVRYGDAWARQWAGVEQEALVKDWCQELAGMSRESFQYAFDHLHPEFPPRTASAFRALAANKPKAPQARSEPEPKATPSVPPKNALAGRKRLFAPPSKTWAERLRDREAAQKPGEGADATNGNLTPAQRAMWRAALGHPSSTPLADTYGAAHAAA